MVWNLMVNVKENMCDLIGLEFSFVMKFNEVVIIYYSENKSLFWYFDLLIIVLNRVLNLVIINNYNECLELIY